MHELHFTHSGKLTLASYVLKHLKQKCVLEQKNGKNVIGK